MNHSGYCDLLRDHQMVDPHCPECGDATLPCRIAGCPIHPEAPPVPIDEQDSIPVGHCGGCGPGGDGECGCL